MKIYHPACFGAFIAILSSPVASQEISTGAVEKPCSTIEDCPGEMYCSTLSNTCVGMGKCNELTDCENPTNNYAVAYCMGTLFCEEGLCGIDCTQMPPEPTEPMPGSKCNTDSDCGKSLGGNPAEMFCASDGFCEPMGGCAVVDDCFSESNAFPIASCMGEMKCDDRKCSQNCVGSDALYGCETTADCPERDSYCNTNGTCRRNGSCSIEKDCFDPDNIFPMIECVGKMYCEQGSCGIKCGEFAEPEPEFCTTSKDCKDKGTYCAGNGTCLPMGGCDRETDCSNPDNSVFLADCVGQITCEEGGCGIRCDEFCTTSKDCGEESYCSGNGKCLPMGGCDRLEDCDSPDNFFMLADCVGQKTCEEDTCGIRCDEFCTTSKDCGEESYCSGNGKCLPMGGCDNIEDCANRENSFMLAACVGEMTCEEDTCGIKCDEFCTTSKDCGEESYCAGNGKCLPMGGCDLLEDCDSPDNFFMMAACVGEKTCEGGMCGIECASTPGNEVFPVDLSVTCTQDSDCNISTSTTRSAEGAEQYCAQGVCKKHGSCASDFDCHNPSNILWNDKRCAGYLHCTSEGMCDRVCGEDCKNGSRAVQCFADPCSIDTCPGATSCYASTCEGDCRAEYLNAAGELFDCASGVSKAAEDNRPNVEFCTTSKDCRGEQIYCAGNGKCLPMGGCNNIEDCANRENSFMLAECVGEMTCEEGRCGIDCATGDSMKDTDAMLSIDSSAIGLSVSLSAFVVVVLVAAVFV